MAEKVLLIDDDVDTLRLVGLMLQRQGYQILAASNGPQALVIAEKELPDLILLDVMMPEMDGYEVARRLRANPKTNHIPIIMFTAKNQTEDKLVGFEAGADDYITKPTQPRELFAHMRAVLSRAQKPALSPTPTYSQPAERGALIGIIGAKGGVGVTTLTLNLGLAIRKMSSKEIILSDYRPGAGTIGLELGYTKVEALSKILRLNEGEIATFDIERNLINHPPGIKLLLSSHDPIEAQNPGTPSHYLRITQMLCHMSQICLLDLGSSFNALFQAIYPLCELILIVFEPTQIAISQAKQLSTSLINLGISQGRILFIQYNRMRSDVMFTRTQVKEMLESEITAIFTPAPELAHHAALNKHPLFTHQPESVTAQQFSELAKNILSTL